MVNGRRKKKRDILPVHLSKPNITKLLGHDSIYLAAQRPEEFARLHPILGKAASLKII